MKSTLFFRFYRLAGLLVFTFLISASVSAQVWSFRNGFGQAGTNGLSDVGRAVCTDAAGNVYITGKISDDLVGNTVSFGGTALVSAGDDDGFVAKFNSAGVHQWSIRFGGTSFTDIGYGIATDGTSVYVVGTVNGAMTVGTSPTSYPVAGGSIDGVVMKLDAASGATTWVTRFGGANTDEGQAICLDPTGNVYISGIFRTRTANATATFGGFTRTVQGNTTAYTSDLFVAQLNASGTFQWVSTGGIAGGNDNINGSGICYVPSLSEVVVTGSFRWASTGTTTATYGGVILTNSSATVNEDFCLLEVAAAGGAFVSGTSAGATDGNEAGLGLTYDASTGDVFFAGSFSGSSVTFPGLGAITNPSPARDNVMYGRYNPTTDAYIWVRDADNGTSGTAADVARAITSNEGGGIIITGNFRNTLTFPGGAAVTASGSLADIFVARVNAATGATEAVTQSSGTSATADDIGYGIAYSPIGGKLWMTGQYASTLTLPPLVGLASVGNKEDILLAALTDGPVITTHPAAVAACTGLPATFTVVAAGAGTLTYSWQEATNSTFTTGLVTLGNTGVYSGTGTATLAISDNTGLTGRYYRVIVSTGAGSVTSNGALLTVTAPTMATGHTTITQAVNTQNNLYYGAGCAIIDKVVPLAGTPISGNVTSDAWVESSVLTFNGTPYVQRHYQITPTAGSTATVTLYFTQAEFDNFNAAPGSTLDLPINSADATGKANLRISKFNGSTSDGTGLPSTYAGAGSLIDPSDANIVYNAAFSRWEVTFDVNGFSGFFIQTSLSVLPVNLLSFSALLVNNDVQVKWQTASETQNDHFEVERSVDGTNFTSIGHRPGNNGTTVSEYDLTDAGAGVNALNSGRLYYRLKIVSQSGKVEYSKVVIILLDNKGVFVTGIMPNPFIGELNVGINAPRNGKMKMTVVDMAGRVLVSQFIEIKKGFSTQSVRDLEKLSHGVYTLMIDFEGTVSTHKIVK